MRPEELPIGASAVRLRYIRFVDTAGVVHDDGPIEIEWSDGSVTVFDTGTDWAFTMTAGRWTGLPALGGAWIAYDAAESPALSRLRGLTLERVEPAADEVEDLIGLDLDFDTVTLELRSWEGEVRARVVPKPPLPA